MLFGIFICWLRRQMCIRDSYKGDSKQVMDHLGITATVQEDGTLTMQEEWTVTLENRDSPYRNIYKTIRLNSGDSIEGLTVYDMDHDISLSLIHIL